MIEPLVVQHGDRPDEEGSSQTRVKDGLDADDNGLGATPRNEGGIGVGWNVSKRQPRSRSSFVGNPVGGFAER